MLISYAQENILNFELYILNFIYVK